jgi:hypothetical protein
LVRVEVEPKLTIIAPAWQPKVASPLHDAHRLPKRMAESYYGSFDKGQLSDRLAPRFLPV